MAKCNSALHIQDNSEGPEIELLINVLLLLVIELDYYTCNYIIMISQVDKKKYSLMVNIRMNHC